MCFLTGLAGSANAASIRVIGPRVFSLPFLLSMAVVGGLGAIWNSCPVPPS